jgi:RND superfamily putative drug exporter
VKRGNAFAASFGGFVARHHRWFLGGWLLLFVVMAYLSSDTPRLLASGFGADTEASHADDILRTHFPERRGPALYAVFHSDTANVSDPQYQAQLAAWAQDLRRAVGTSNAIIEGPQSGNDGRTAALFVESNEDVAKLIDIAKRVAAVKHAGPARVYVGGQGAVFNSFLDATEADLSRSETFSGPVAILLLLLVFGGLVAAALPVLTGLATVICAVAVLGFIARYHTVSIFALNVSTVIGLGLGIDYSLLVTNRFREEMRAGATVEQAVATTAGTAGVAILISGGTVLIGFGALMLSHLNTLWSMGLGCAVVVAASILASLTLIPALLALFGRNVDRLALPFTRGRDTRAFWHGLATIVMRRPLVFILVVLVVVLALASPVRSFYPGVGGAESLPPGDPTFTADQLLRDQFGAPLHPPILVVATGVKDLSGAADLENALRSAGGGQVRGAPDVEPQLQTNYLKDGIAIYEVAQPDSDNDRSTRDFLDRLRAVPHPSGANVLLTGEAALYQGYLKVLGSDFPKIFAVVLALTFLLLLVSFRSIALPIKAVLMNLLSVGAAIGILTWGFQEGHLAALLDFKAVGFIDALVPVVMFCGLFGLSMDYEVFLLSRIREEYLAGKDNSAAVAAGMERTGQIITSAALILVVVIGTLVFSRLTINKALSVSFASAIFLDATLIRLLLVPAMMRVLGNVNWWPGARPRAVRNATRT